MIKYYCDRCGIECNELEKMSIPSKKYSYEYTKTEEVSLCEGCAKQAKDIFDNCTDIRLMMFGKFMQDAKGGAE